jgi:hypothetical protein
VTPSGDRPEHPSAKRHDLSEEKYLTTTPKDVQTQDTEFFFNRNALLHKIMEQKQHKTKTKP